MPIVQKNSVIWGKTGNFLHIWWENISTGTLEIA